MKKKDGKAKTRPNGDMNAVAIAGMHGISTKDVFRKATKSYQRNHWKKDDVKYRDGHSVYFKKAWIDSMFPRTEDKKVKVEGHEKKFYASVQYAGKTVRASIDFEDSWKLIHEIFHPLVFTDYDLVERAVFVYEKQ